MSECYQCINLELFNILFVKESLIWGEKAVYDSSDSPQLDAELLLQEASGLSTAQQISRADQALSKSALATYQVLIAERAKGVPIAYLLGLKEFYSIDFVVTPDVLIPRPETELLVDLALDLIPTDSPCRVLDLGTGSGAIAISLAKHRPQATILAVEKSAAALAIAQQNAVMAGVNSLEFFLGSWFEPLAAGKEFDVIVSNPPYIDANDPHLQQGDVRFEPEAALVASEQGLADYQQIIASAKAFLKPGGNLLFEHGCEQGKVVAELLCQAGFLQVQTSQDLAARDRVTSATVAG